MASAVCMLCLLMTLSVVVADKVDQATQTDFCGLLDIGRLSVIDILRFGVLGIVLLAVIISDKRGEVKNLQRFESAAFALDGLSCYFFPREILSFVTTQSVKSTHVFCLQVAGALEIGTAVIVYLQLKNDSRDPVVTLSWLLSRVFGMSIVSFTIFRVQQASHIFTDQCMATFVVSLSAYLGGLLYKLLTLRFRDQGRREAVSTPVKTWLILHTLLVAVGGLSQLSIPEYMSQKYLVGEADDLLLFIVRILGAFGITRLFQVVFSLKYADHEDRQAFLAAQVLTLLLVLPMIVLYQLKDPVYLATCVTSVFSIGFIDLLITTAVYHEFDLTFGLLPVSK